MAAQEDFLYEDDLDALLIAIDAEHMENDPTMEAEMDGMISEIPIEEESNGFPCSYCDKVCLSKRGLSRHTNAKHTDAQQPSSSSNTTPKTTPKKKDATEILHPLYFKKYLEECIVKLAADECYPDEIIQEFKNYKVGDLNDVIFTYNLVRDLIESFDGNRQKFYPLFYKRISEAEKVFVKPLSRDCSLLLGFKVANNVLSHLSGSSVKEGVMVTPDKSPEFSEKDQEVICYLSGYVFGTFYRRIRFSKSRTQNIYRHQCLSLLLAGKVPEDSAENPQFKLINARDRGGLWKVRKEVVAIFMVAESLFKLSVTKNHNKVDSKEMVASLMKDSSVLCNFTKVSNLCSEPTKKEISLNLLQDLLMLYIRLRTFSYAKDKQEQRKCEKI